MTDRDLAAQEFLNLIKRSRRGKFKIYIGMSAGVGKTYRMLQEAHSLLKGGVDVRIGFIETHNRKETHALLEGIPTIPLKTFFYKGKELREMDLEAIIRERPEIVIVDELAHSNIEGSRNKKRWQDVLEILDAGINVISAVNIQHIESLNQEVQEITGIEVQERIPDKMLAIADEVVNIDLTADELIIRLKEGKIYQADKIQAALTNFFKSEHILQLRELALKEVASQVERKVENEIPRNQSLKHEKLMACISTNEVVARALIRKTARLSRYYNAKWFVLFVETPRENPDNIPLSKQRHLINNFKLATELGGEVLKVSSPSVTGTIIEMAEKYHISTICIGRPHFSIWNILAATGVYHRLLKKMSSADIDLVILSK